MWLAYRKMYKAAFIFFGVILVVSILVDVVCIGILGQKETPGEVSVVVGFIFALICADSGNRWYLTHAQKTIAEVRAQQLEGETHLQTLADRGGTHLIFTFGFVMFCFLVLGIISVIVDTLLSPFNA
ncbi:MAG: DUF2628 domain-containing protein [Pirellulaceae bacterium]